MEIMIKGWNDCLNSCRKNIIENTISIIIHYFGGPLLNYDLCISNENSVNCIEANDCPCTCPNRNNICIAVQDNHWCQFVYQLAHELCHCTTSRKTLPQSIKWFDEFICCFSSYFVLYYIAFIDKDINLINLYDDNHKVFKEYWENIKTRKDQTTRVKDTKQFYNKNKVQYIKDENLIKKHDVYYIEFFNSLNNNFKGLKFIGKMHEIEVYDGITIEKYLQRLINLCDKQEEKECVYKIIDIFGLNIKECDK